MPMHKQITLKQVITELRPDQIDRLCHQVHNRNRATWPRLDLTDRVALVCRRALVEHPLIGLYRPPRRNGSQP